MNTSDSFCNTDESFNSLLKSNSEIKIKSNQLEFKGSKFDYKLTSGNINEPQGDSRYFNVKLKTNEINDSNTELLTELTRQIKIIIGKITDHPAQTIWDDLSHYYSVQAYPLIHEIENILRKLITKFMLVNVGASWSKNAIPDALKSTSREGAKPAPSKERAYNHNILYDADFIKLADFLFEEYRDYDVNELIKKLKKISLNDSRDIKEFETILNFIPKSNWDRYFSAHINCQDTFLKSKWARLYELRCQIAHNNTFTKLNLEETRTIISKIKPFLEEANEKLENIVVPEKEKENLVNSIDLNDIENLKNKAKSNSEKLIRNTNFVSSLIFDIAKITSSIEYGDSQFILLDKLEKAGILNKDITYICRYAMLLLTDNDRFSNLEDFEIDVINAAVEENINTLLRTRNILAHPPTEE